MAKPDTLDAYRVPTAAAWLGGLGLLPFLAGAAALWLLGAPQRETALFVLIAYAAVILSFMGAIHWGLAMAGPHGYRARSMAMSVVPALVAWAALSLPAAAALMVMGAGFIGVFVMDMQAIARGLAPIWYRRLRLPLTVAVLACLGAALSAISAPGAV